MIKKRKLWPDVNSLKPYSNTALLQWNRRIWLTVRNDHLMVLVLSTRRLIAIELIIQRLPSVRQCICGIKYAYLLSLGIIAIQIYDSIWRVLCIRNKLKIHLCDQIRMQQTVQNKLIKLVWITCSAVAIFWIDSTIL